MLCDDTLSGVASRDGRGEVLHRICIKLLERDPDIFEVALFSSSIYEPELFRDVDPLTVSSKSLTGVLPPLGTPR